MSPRSTKTDNQPIPVPRKRKPVATEPLRPEPTVINEETIIFKRSHFYAALSVLTFFFGILAGYAIWGTDLFSKAGSDSQAVNQAPVVEDAPQVVRYDIPAEGYPSIGPADAPITIVEFSDFQCPFCKRWHAEVYKPLLEAYPGKIRFVYRNLPLTTIHPDAQSAAEAALCAGEQNAFWQFHDKLLSGELLGTGVYTQYASDLNLNTSTFESCLTANKYQAAIQKDSDFAINLGVNSTPTFFINGLAVVGAQPLDVFKQVIDKELAGDFPE
jgi:protein-disulfide isomerase